MNEDIMVNKLKFESYWNLHGVHYWNNKTDGWVNWVHERWNLGVINLEEYRELIMVDME